METTMSEPNEKALVAQILSSYLSNNTVAAADLPSVIDSVKRAFVGSGEAGGMENAPKALARIILAEQVRRGARP
jgi:predicted transcriptional regulator